MSSLYYPKFVENPKIITKEYGGYIKQVYVVDVVGEEYDICVENAKSKNFWAAQQKGKYREGIINSGEHPNLAQEVGYVGQMAFSKLMGIPIRVGYIKKGDKYDAKIGDTKFDMKYSHKEYKCGWITRKKDNKVHPINSDIYIFGYTEPIDGGRRTYTVGWMSGKRVKRKKNTKSPKKGFAHLNKEIPFWELSSIVRLRDKVLVYKNDRENIQCH